MLEGLLFPVDEAEAPEAGALLRVSRAAMATRFEITLPLGTPDAVEAAEEALDLIDDLEDQLTVYREHSEISQLNANAFHQPVEVEPALFSLLQDCQRLTLATRGAFDIACGALIRTWGFLRRQGRIPDRYEHAAAMRASGMPHVLLDDRALTVRYLRQGLEINLGSIGKGYALDRAGRLLREGWGIRSALLHAGGSSVLALGAPPGEHGWCVSIRHPSHEHRTLGTVRLRDQGFGTSAATYQSFDYNGSKYGHVLDPRSGRPAEAAASASIVAGTATGADALATAAFVLGIDAARDFGPGVILPDAACVTPDVFGLDGRYDPPGLRETLHDLLAIP